MNQVLDARDPLGTRSTMIEEYLRKEKTHKHLIFVLNKVGVVKITVINLYCIYKIIALIFLLYKVDLVPTWVTQRWVAVLSQEVIVIIIASLDISLVQKYIFLMSGADNCIPRQPEPSFWQGCADQSVQATR